MVTPLLPIISSRTAMEIGSLSTSTPSQSKMISEGFVIRVYLRDRVSRFRVHPCPRASVKSARRIPRTPVLLQPHQEYLSWPEMLWGHPWLSELRLSNVLHWRQDSLSVYRCRLSRHRTGT